MATKLTRIRVQSCGNGDDCPALDRRDDGRIEVTGYPVQRDNLPDGEAVVVVPPTLLPEVADLAIPNLGAWIRERHRSDVLRVQTLDFYNVPSDGEDYRRYLAGAAEPNAAAKQPWLESLREGRAAGRLRRNVHIVRAPLNDYLRYQFEWCYTYNVSAGQDIRVLDLAEHPEAASLAKLGDFTVVEGVHVARSRYADDRTFLGAVEVSADAGESYAAAAETAWALGTPFTTWWNAHPQYHRSKSAA